MRREKRHIERMPRQSPDKREAAARRNVGLSALHPKVAERKITMP